jgi:hypothetical protein
MVSLSTVYGVSIVLGSLAAMGASYLGTKVYPIQTGGDPLAGPATLAAAVTGAFAAAEKALEPAPEPLATETVKEEPAPEIVPAAPAPEPASEPSPTVDLDKLKMQIQEAFEGNEEAASNIIQFLKTPVKDWEQIAPTLMDLSKKFRMSLTHPNLNKCPANILEICTMVSQKFSNMKDLINGNEFTELGDQTEQAFKILNTQ